MNTKDIIQLNQSFALNKSGNHLVFVSGSKGIPVIEITNQHASARISLQGAHLLSWIPEGEADVLWLSEDAVCAAGKSIRGGIPICWPWFGAHASNTSYPAHGFARTIIWHVNATQALANGNTIINLSITPQTETESMWPADTELNLCISIGKKLEMELTTRNNGTQAVVIGQAFHTYFKVGDISEVLLHGLDDTDYLDKPDNFKRKVQHGHITIENEVDRIYLDTASDCVIEDNSLKRNIIIRKCGSHSTVVWNPWKKIADKMGDLGKDGYKKMLCVESSNAAEDVVTIEPGKSHQLWIQYEVQPVINKHDSTTG